jgi:hypothetical protein
MQMDHAANVTSLVVRGLSGVDAGQSHPGIRLGEYAPLLGVNFFPFLQAQGDRHRLA